MFGGTHRLTNGSGPKRSPNDLGPALMTGLPPHIIAATGMDALRAQDIPGIAKQAVAEAHLNYPVPRYMIQAECEELLGEIVAH